MTLPAAHAALAAIHTAATDAEAALLDVAGEVEALTTVNVTLTADVEQARAELAKAHARIAELEALLPKPGTLFGVNLANPVPGGHVPAAARIYFPPGAFNKTQRWAGSDAAKAYDAGCRTFIVSVKDYVQTTRIGAYLDTVPDDARIYGCYFHEHEGNVRDGDLTAEQYRSRFAAVAPVFRERGHDFGPIHNGMNRNAAGKWAFGVGYVEPDLSICTYWGTDCYDPNGKGVELFAPIVDYAKPLGLPMVVGETGAVYGGDQAAWATQAREWFTGHGFAAVCWWNQQFAGKPDWRMTAETAKAWLSA